MADVQLEKINKIYPNGFHAVHDLTLDLADGEFLVLVGPSGCGKSTALRMVAGLEEISGGDLMIGDRRVNDVEPRDRDIAMVFQNYALYPQMSVRDNIGFPLRLKKVEKKARKQQENQAAGILELMEQMDKKPATLSGGQRQRVAMGRAIVRRPSLFLMDEPLSNLDAKLRVQMRAEISGIQRDLGVTTIYVTHDQVEAMTMGDRVAVLKDGHLQQVSDPETLYAEPANVFVAAFIGSPSMNLTEGVVSADGDNYKVTMGDQTVGLSASFVESRPALSGYLDKPVIVGFRPEDLEDAALMPGHPADQRLKATVGIREALGAETLIHFSINSTAVDSGDPDALDELGDDSETRCTARFSPKTKVKRGEEIDISIVSDAMHFFDRQTHLAIR